MPLNQRPEGSLVTATRKSPEQFRLVATHEGPLREESLEARDVELAILAGHHRWGSEVNCRLDRCRRLARLGRLRTEDIAETRAVIAKLRKPQSATARLDAIERGEWA